MFISPLSRLDLKSAAKKVAEECIQTSTFKYVVTPNIDHIVNLNFDADFRSSYKNSFLSFADGWPVVLAARMFGYKIPGRVSGSDLVPAVLAYANQNHVPLSVFVLGGLNDVPKRAAEFISRNYPNIHVAGYLSPPFGFEKDTDLSSSIASIIHDSGANFIVLGLGSPKQEKWACTHSHLLPKGVGVCAGATVDFLAGSLKRAPQWISRIGFEWLYRITQEPKRLFYRYARSGFIFPLLLVKEMLRKALARP